METRWTTKSVFTGGLCSIFISFFWMHAEKTHERLWALPHPVKRKSQKRIFVFIKIGFVLSAKLFHLASIHCYEYSNTSNPHSINSKHLSPVQRDSNPSQLNEAGIACQQQAAFQVGLYFYILYVYQWIPLHILFLQLSSSWPVLNQHLSLTVTHKQMQALYIFFTNSVWRVRFSYC